MGGVSIGDVLSAFRRRNGIPTDEAVRTRWTCRIGPVSVQLPNFQWRKDAILAHDLHHILTGYPCTLRGECHVAAREFGAGTMPHWAAWLFCLPSVLIGFLWSPRRQWNAFATGRSSHSLHNTNIDRGLLAASVETLRSNVDKAGQPVMPLQTVLLFTALLIEATAMLSIPLVAGAALCRAFCSSHSHAVTVEPTTHFEKTGADVLLIAPAHGHDGRVKGLRIQ